jgi:hypothetical protein
MAMTPGPNAPDMGCRHLDPQRDMSAEWDAEQFAIHTDDGASVRRVKSQSVSQFTMS